MAPSEYPVELTDDERAELEAFLQRGEQPVRAARRARILLMADDGVVEREIAEALGCSRPTAYQVRKRYHERGIDAVHRKQPDRNYERKLDGETEARLIALACSDPPEGRSRWTLRLLADELVTLDEIEFDSVAHETVRKTLKKTDCSPIDSSSG
jgi:transposase